MPKRLKEPGIPNLYPYKAQLISSLEGKEEDHSEKLAQLQDNARTGKSVEDYLEIVQARVQRYEEEKKLDEDEQEFDEQSNATAKNQS